MVVIAVVGTAARTLPPERGTVRLRVVGEGPTRAGAVDPVVPVHARVVEQARAFEAAGEATRWSAASVGTSVEQRYEGAERPQRVHVAVAPVEIRFRDLDALRRWVGGLLDEPLIQVDGVEWSLTDATRSAVERELRAEAVRDAIARAGDYAAALGSGAAEPVRLWEAGLRPRGGELGRATAMSRFAAGGEGVDLHPAPIDVEVALTADFESAPPPAAG